jgi:hypothetical protein
MHTYNYTVWSGGFKLKPQIEVFHFVYISHHWTTLHSLNLKLNGKDHIGAQIRKKSL